MTHEAASLSPLQPPSGVEPGSPCYERIRMILKRFGSFSPREIDILRFASQHPGTRGAWLLRLLIEHPGRKHSALLLSAILNGHCTPDCLSLPAGSHPHSAFSSWMIDPAWGCFEAPIPAADLTTLRAVKARLEYLDGILKHRRGCSRHPLALERQALKQYLAQTSSPAGKPRAFPGNYRRACQALSRALQRFLALIERADPSLAGYARQHLCQGMRFGWKVAKADGLDKEECLD